jgi:hypothetical protein
MEQRGFVRNQGRARGFRSGSGLAVVTDKGYFSTRPSEYLGRLTPLIAYSRRQFGSGVDHSYFALEARGRRFGSCHTPDKGACSSAAERLAYCDRPFSARTLVDLAVAMSAVTSGERRFDSYTAARLPLRTDSLVPGTWRW